VKTRLPIVIATAAVLSAAAVVGCNRNKTSAARSSALDITPPPTPVYTQPQPVMAQPGNPTPLAQPVVYDTQPSPQYAAQTSATPTFADAGNRYTVKKGDTLFSIAKSRYGNGNQWQRIASANPGLTPQGLKAGQTITIPN
jgi:5'-nucleotidase / UDP-sugar diphosphatase